MTAGETASLPTAEDPIPGIEQEEPADLEMERVFGAHEAVVNADLRGKGKISQGQTFRSLQLVNTAYRTRILSNPMGYLQVAQKRAGKEAA